MTSRPGARIYTLISIASLFLSGSVAVWAQTNVLTWHNDNARTGQNTTEAILTPSTVSASKFGLLANVVLDGKVDAEPLYVSAMNLRENGLHNQVFVVTEHDTLYALEADTGAIEGSLSLLGPGEVPSDSRSCDQVSPEIGATATPVIDLNAGPHGTIYIVAMSKDSSGNYYQRIHAIDIVTGVEQFGGPVTVHATYPGTGDGSTGGVVTFDPKQYKERPGLLLQNGVLYTSWGSHCDIRPYAGWMMAYNQYTLGQIAAIDLAPNGNDAALWNSGAGPAADAAGNVYVAVANGTFDEALNSHGFPMNGDYGNAMLKLRLEGNSLVPIDYWTMYNSDAESDVDTDLGSGGLMLLPDMVDVGGNKRQLAVAAGKDHNIYVTDRNNMGHYDAVDDGTIYEQLTGALPGGEWSSPAYFNSHVYFGSVGQNLRSFSVSKAQILSSPVQTTPTNFGYPGTTPSVSAWGTSNGIVWATENTSPAVLHAYDANDLATEFYNSNQASGGRDHFGAGNKFVVPTVANGKLYVGSQNSVAIFGLIRQTPPPLPDGIYVLKNNSSHLVLDDPGLSTTSGIAMYQWSANGGPNQQWFVSYNGSGYYTVQNVSSKLFLTDADGSTTPGISLRQATPTQDPTQLWSLRQTASGYVIQNKASGMAIDDSNFNPNAGPNIILWPSNGGINQTWTLRQSF